MGWREEAFERGPVPTVVYSSDGVPVDANASYRAMFGLETGSGPGVGVRVFLHPDDDHGNVQDAWERVGSGGARTEPTEVRVRAADGSWRRVVVSAADVPGHPEVIVSLLDVTAQHEAEAERVREVQYLRSLLDRSADVITVLEADGTWRSTTAQGPRILGYPDGYAPEGGVWALLHPDDTARASAAVGRAVEGCCNEVAEPIEVRLATADGGYRRFEVVGVNLLDDPAVAGVVVTARDVTERHEVRVALAASEARYRDLVARMQEGLWVIDADGVTTFVNPRMAEMLATTPEEMIGSPMYDWIPPDDHSTAGDRLAVRRHGVGENHEMVFRRADGGVLTALVASTPLMTDGAMVEVFGVVTDISELKAAQAELAVALRRAQEADRAKSVFLSHVSHELRTPLNGVLGYAGLLRSSADDPTTVREFAAEIEFAGRHLLRLIEDLLNVTRLQTGPVSVRPEVVPVADIVIEAARLAGIPDGRLRVDVGDRTVSADPTRLRQILVNLLANAATHGPRDGTVTVTAAHADGRARITVADEGPGIPAADTERIFEPFVRLGSGQAASPAGTGLGLPISRTLVEAMDGALTYESGPPSGFVIDLPAAAPAERSGAGSGPRACHIVAVEDDPVSLRLLDAILGREPHYTHATAATLSEARRLIATTGADAVLLDVHLPDGNGLDLLRELRARPATAHLPVVVLTADTGPELRDEALDAGATGFHTKPYDIPALIATLHSLAPSGTPAAGG